jgi:alanyl-tRNA synthetase
MSITSNQTTTEAFQSLEEEIKQLQIRSKLQDQKQSERKALYIASHLKRLAESKLLLENINNNNTSIDISNNNTNSIKNVKAKILISNGGLALGGSGGGGGELAPLRNDYDSFTFNNNIRYDNSLVRSSTPDENHFMATNGETTNKLKNLSKLK